MANFVCHKCKQEFKETGMCPECNIALEKNCPTCGEEFDACVCADSKVHTERRKH